MRYLRGAVNHAFSYGLGACPALSQMRMTCPAGSVLSPDGSRCIPAGMAGLGACTGAAAAPGSYTCAPGFVLSADGTRCLPGMITGFSGFGR